VLVPEIDMVSLIAALAGHLVHYLDGPHGADFHTSLFAMGIALLHTIPCTDAQVAFCGHVSSGVPDDPARHIGASFDAGSATVAQSLIHNSDIAVLAINMKRSSGACLHAKGIGALPTYADGNILGERLEGTLHDLNPREGEARDPFVN